jgi:hypothetical protein
MSRTNLDNPGRELGNGAFAIAVLISLGVYRGVNLINLGLKDWSVILTKYGKLSLWLNV